MPWDPPDLIEDPDEVTDRMIADMAETMEGWESYDGNPEVVLASEVGREIAVLHTSAVSIALNQAIAGMGETAFNFPAYLGVTASIPVLVTVNLAGAVIPQGFTVVGINGDGTEVAFELLEDVTTEDTDIVITMTATDAGDYGNTVPAGNLTVVVSTAVVISAEATAPSTGGADPETLEEYLGRFVDYTATLRPGGVRATDLAALARSVPGVHRALGVDLYDPADPETPAERTATVFPIDENGAPVSDEVADQVQAVLEASREVNFIIHVEQPTYTPIAIEYEAVADSDTDPVVVATAIQSAVLDWLSNWGTTADDDQAWEPVTVIRHLQLAKIAGSAPGVAYLSSITINGDAADFTLPGVAPLPSSPDDPDTPSTVTGTVS